jgi:hypothetical protein
MVVIMQGLIPINKVELTGETVRQIFFINISGGDKTIIVFESGKVLVMPVYRECPVQVGGIEDLKIDFDMFIKSIEADKRAAVEQADEAIRKIKEL